MRIVFVMRHSGYVRNFESTLRMLCDRGHHVHLAFQAKVRHWLLDATDIAQQLCDRYPNFSQGTIPVREDGWGLLGRRLRLSVDYLRYLNPEYQDAPKLRERAGRDVPPLVRRLTERGPARTPAGRKMLGRCLRIMDRAIARDAQVDAFFEEQRPDLLLVTPLIEPGAPQSEYVRSARARGVRTVLCVASWDNLTNKGLIHEPLDLVTVWNESMKEEAIRFHRVPPERVAVTGAAAFDHWFEWRPSTTREQFCGRVGLRADRPYLLYLCSSKFVAPEETPFVRKWVEYLRRSNSSVLREAGVLVRPHPQNAPQWRTFDASDLGHVRVFPPEGAAPVDDQSRAEYFDSMYHSAAVVGINTTAEIESAIIGRGVYTLLAPEFRDTQEGTLHFHHLRQVNGGLLHVAETFEEHAQQIEAALCGQGDDGRCRRFVEAFVRPYGIDVPSTPRLVAALEELGARPAPPPARGPAWASLGRPLLAPLAERARKEALLAIEAKTAKAAARRQQNEKGKDKKHDAQKGGQEKVTEREARAAKDKAAAPPAEPTPRAADVAGKKSPAPAAAKRPVDWHDLKRGFLALEHADRVRFLRATATGIPPETWLHVVNLHTERLDYPDAEIHLRVSCNSERRRLRACAKEPWTVDWIDQMVCAGEVLYDIGANVGAYSLVAAKKPGGAARVFAFEPSYATLASLCANIVLNEAASHITPLPVAVSNRNALDIFKLLDVEPGAARHSLGPEPSDEGPTVWAQPVLTYRLDDLIEHFGLPSPNHVKLDVDGGELDVLEGAAATLASPALRSMLIEVSTSLSEQITALLARHGLHLQSKVNVKNKAGEYLVWYGLFAREHTGDLLARAQESQASR